LVIKRYCLGKDIEGFEKNMDDWVQALSEELDNEKQDGVIAGASG